MIPLNQKIEFRNKLLANPTKAEDLLHKKLSIHPVLKNNYECQAIVHGFIIDFWFPKRKIALEIDGAIHRHKEQAEKDKTRTAILNKYGIKVIRTANKEIYSKIQYVINRILNINKLGAKRREKGSFIKDHFCKYQKYGGSGSIRRKRNPAGASNPKTANS